ncbi:elongation factor P maturation arginine rhamnosyltransferase EarP [Shewanella sp. Isolate11]|uniref:elongation factor P maturation arginine rhamnosyltransferase EarP n=1 Tax=Shewanella sp. Isolate11 TaxID=2908530 RepID=UPI001EFC3356|nr:elongation factor P maturation arginine rhamnosyltransferase EarP [Shewanella sp. Isolate11]MCG9696743.1 elongation factor P maturation arginine rhamnosyltransferase EarP [Shewanella sp. Isolate11]
MTKSDSTNLATSQHWDIFCAVVDNYGDIGVTWRLAKQLAAEYQLSMILWVDDLNSFSHILPELDPSKAIQSFNQVIIKQWNQPLDLDYQPGAVLIEAFACELPPQVIEQINHYHRSSEHTAPLWLNLEYLSAEDWVEGCHGLPSLQSSGIKKYFYFPGFTPKTGGLICEADLLVQRAAWQNDIQHKQSLFAELGLTGIAPEDKVISIFSYESPSLAALCSHWQQGDKKIHALIPLGRSLNSLKHYFPDLTQLQAGQSVTIDNLTLHILPMTDQQNFDRLLWSCDFNIVRGEDSFLRAQWAAKPFIWHIYPQEDDYHLIKLRAFMALYCHNLAPEIANSWTALNLAFNQGDTDTVIAAWEHVGNANKPLQQHVLQWQIDALNDADLATRLVQFVKNS